MYLADDRRERRKRLDLISKVNKEYDDNLKVVNKLMEDVSSLSTYIDNLNNVKIVLMASQKEYNDEMIDKIERAIMFGINLVMDTKKYDVKLVPETYRNKNILKLYFIDEDNNMIPPKVVEGDMINQVLSFAAISLIAYMSGYERVYYDEAFASANVRSQVAIRNLIKEFSDMGMKFILVSQSPVLLAGLTRHVVDLKSNGRSVSEVIEFDVDGNLYDESTDEYLIDLLDTVNRGGNLNEFDK